MSALSRYTLGSPDQMLNDVRSLKHSLRDHPIPDNAVPFFTTGSFAAPAWGLANQIVLCTYQCPIGWEGLLTDVMNLYTGSDTFVEGSGDIVWTIDIDFPLAAALGTGRALPGYNAITRGLGDLSEPWPIRRGWRMKSGETYRYKARTVQNVQVGSPAFVHGSLQGIVWPEC